MIRTFLQWTALIIVVFALQTTLMPIITVAGIRPDLLVLVLFFLGFKHDVIPAVFAGFFIGLAQDFYSPILLGQNALSKTVAGFFAGFFNERIMRMDPLFQLLIFSLMFLLHDLVFYSVQAAKFDTPLHTIGLEIITSTIPRIIYTLFFALIPTFREYFFSSTTSRR